MYSPRVTRVRWVSLRAVGQPHSRLACSCVQGRAQERNAQMNAHHRKASYRPPPPPATTDTRSYSAGAGAAPHSCRLTNAIRRLPYAWQVRSLSGLVGMALSSLNSPPPLSPTAARRHHPARRRPRQSRRLECTATHRTSNRNRSIRQRRKPRRLARPRIPKRSHPKRLVSLGLRTRALQAVAL